MEPLVQTTLVLLAAALFAGGVLLDAQMAAAAPAAAPAAPHSSTPTGMAAEEARLLAQAARPYRSGDRPAAAR